MQGEETRQNIPWVEKYRPTTLDNVVHHANVIGTRTAAMPCQEADSYRAIVQRFVGEGRLPHLLFYGPPGTGKTSTAVALAHDIFGTGRAGMVLELNASDERGIGVVRDQIKTFAATKTLALASAADGPAYKLIILDECDAMTAAAQNALRRGTQTTAGRRRVVLMGPILAA